MKAPLTDFEMENLSAYLDGQLDPKERAQLQKRLDTQPELKRALEDLRRTKVLLRSAPRRRAPRNFTLKAGTVPAPRKSWFSLVPSLGLASALATVLLMITVAIEFLPGLNPARQLTYQSAAPAPVNKQVDRAAESQPAAPAGTSAPIIIWGQPGGMGGGGGADSPPGMGGGAGGGEPLAPAGTPSTEKGLTPRDTAQSGTPTPAPAIAISPTPVPAMQGAGPILGIRPTEEQGQVSTAPGSSRDNSETRPAANSAPVPAQPATDLRGWQLLLVLIAVSAGAAAIYLRRRT